MFPLTMAGLGAAAAPGAAGMGAGGAAAAGGMAAMGPVGWTMLGLSALGALAPMMGKKQNTTKFLDPINVGEKPIMNAGNPYQSPMAATGQDPYGRMMNPMMRRPPMLSSALGRYGGLG